MLVSRKTLKMVAVVSALALAALFFCSQSSLFSANTVKFSGLMLTFSDGSTEILGDNDEMSIYDYASGKKVVSVSTIVSVNPVYSGVIESYSFSGRSSFLFVRSDSSVVNLGTQPLAASGYVLPSGQSSVIIAGSMSASSLESLARSYGGVNNVLYKFRLHAEEPVVLTLNFVGGASQSLSYDLPDFDWWYRLGV